MDRYINVIDMKRKKEKNRKGRRSIKLDKRKQGDYIKKERKKQSCEDLQI